MAFFSQTVSLNCFFTSSPFCLSVIEIGKQKGRASASNTETLPETMSMA